MKQGMSQEMPISAKKRLKKQAPIKPLLGQSRASRQQNKKIFNFTKVRCNLFWIFIVQMLVAKRKNAMRKS